MLSWSMQWSKNYNSINRTRGFFFKVFIRVVENVHLICFFANNRIATISNARLAKIVFHYVNSWNLFLVQLIFYCVDMHLYIERTLYIIYVQLIYIVDVTIHIIQNCTRNCRWNFGTLRSVWHYLWGIGYCHKFCNFLRIS